MNGFPVLDAVRSSAERSYSIVRDYITSNDDETDNETESESMYRYTKFKPYSPPRYD